MGGDPVPVRQQVDEPDEAAGVVHRSPSPCPDVIFQYSGVSGAIRMNTVLRAVFRQKPSPELSVLPIRTLAHCC
jgi:hypothetical protein